MTPDRGETADQCMRGGFEAALSLGSVFWEKPNREHVFAALLADNTPARRTLRTVSAQCALLQQGHLVRVAGDPSAERVLVDGRVAGERVTRMPNPDRAAAATLGLLPLPSAILTRLTVGTVVRERRGRSPFAGTGSPGIWPPRCWQHALTAAGRGTMRSVYLAGEAFLAWPLPKHRSAPGGFKSASQPLRTCRTGTGTRLSTAVQLSAHSRSVGGRGRSQLRTYGLAGRRPKTSSQMVSYRRSTGTTTPQLGR